MTLHINFVDCLILDFVSSYCWIPANKGCFFFSIINLSGMDAVFFSVRIQCIILLDYTLLSLLD